MAWHLVAFTSGLLLIYLGGEQFPEHWDPWRTGVTCLLMIGWATFYMQLVGFGNFWEPIAGQ